MLIFIRKRILSRSARLGVMGLGYVGLPLAMEFCRASYKGIGFEVDSLRVGSIQRGESYVVDVPSEVVAIALQEKRFLPTTDFNHLQEDDAVSVCVPTPLLKTKESAFPPPVSSYATAKFADE
ncbi:MAG: hypothetical protein HPY52_13905 [Firmicutes bacterium]|nr:hypothetical protein [Bacillota bacterium]